MQGYDSHLILTHAKPRHGEIEVVPINMQKFIAFSVGRLQFKDSMAFLHGSLASHAELLPREQLVSLRKYFSQTIVDGRMEAKRFNFPSYDSQMVCSTFNLHTLIIY